jgi:hypothetical protein
MITDALVLRPELLQFHCKSATLQINCQHRSKSGEFVCEMAAGRLVLEKDWPLNNGEGNPKSLTKAGLENAYEVLLAWYWSSAAKSSAK